MANKSVLELAVGTGQWDAGLKKAKDALNNFTQAQGGLQNALKSDSDKMQQFVQMMGKMDSTAKTAKGQMNDYKGTIEQLTMQYNRMTDAQKKTIGQDYLQAIDQMKQKYQAVNKEIEEMNRQLKATSEVAPSVSGGGGFGGMMQVFGGNILTKMAEWGASLTGEVAAALNESAKLAKEAEGVQIAFRRLGRGDILDGLREATHNTVSDLELMKAAVKFNDFKLPVEELGTMLAFAQQKAKDTGQSIDYMVDSIVTGLGRKSLMILDNLGLSAAEIRDKMKETGDMTKAVGEIIREQMSKAGDYVETAADRVAKANVELNNQMLELGNTMQDVLGFSGWDELATMIKTEVVGAIQFTIETIGEAKNAWNSFMQTIGVKDKPKKDNRPTRMPDGTYWETTDAQGNVTASGRWLNGKRVQTGLGDVVVNGHTPDKSNTRTTHTPKVSAQADDFKEMEEVVGLLNLQKQKLDDLQAMKPFAETEEEIARLNREIDTANQEYQRLLNLGKELKTTDILAPAHDAWRRGDLKGYMDAQKKVGGDVSPAIGSDAFSYTSGNLDAFINNLKQQLSTADVGSELYNNLTAQLADATTLGNLIETAIKNGIDIAQFDPQAMWKKIFGDNPGDYISNEEWQNKFGTVSQKTGKKIQFNPKTGEMREDKKKEDGLAEFSKDFSAITGSVNGILSGIQNLGIEIPEGLAKTIGVIQTISGILTAILTITTAIQATSSADATASWLNAIIPFARGGIAHAANGFVGGSTFSGDQIPIMVNSGELILNRAQQGAIASQLQGSGMAGMQLSAVITGEQLRLVLNNNGRRTGRGEYVTTNFR